MKNIILALLSVFLMLAFVSAGDIARIGTTGGNQLLIPVGARSIAMGQASIASAKGVEAIYWNPAGLITSDKSEFMFSNVAHIADITQNYFAGAINMSSSHALGFHIQTLDFGDIEETTTSQPEGTGRTYSPTFFVLGLTYSTYLTDKIVAGVTGKFISEEIMETGGNAFAFDFGIKYLFRKNLTLGVGLKNLGSKITYEGRNLESKRSIEGSDLGSDEGYYRGVAEGADIASTFSFGISYVYDLNETSAIRLNSAFSNNNDYYDEVFTGFEYGYSNLVFLRAGYNLTPELDDSLYGLSFGAGLNYDIGGFTIQIDYAYRQLTDYFDDGQIFTMKIGF